MLNNSDVTQAKINAAGGSQRLEAAIAGGGISKTMDQFRNSPVKFGGATMKEEMANWARHSNTEQTVTSPGTGFSMTNNPHGTAVMGKSPSGSSYSSVDDGQGGRVAQDVNIAGSTAMQKAAASYGQKIAAQDQKAYQQSMNKLFQNTDSWAKENGVSKEEANEMKRGYNEEIARNINKSLENSELAKKGWKAHIGADGKVGLSTGQGFSPLSAEVGVGGGFGQYWDNSNMQKESISASDQEAIKQVVSNATSEANRKMQNTKLGKTIQNTINNQSGYNRNISFANSAEAGKTTSDEYSRNAYVDIANQRAAVLAKEEGTNVNDSHLQQAIQSIEKDVREGNTQALFGDSVPNSADIKNGVTGQIADAQNKTAPADNIKTGGSVPTYIGPSNVSENNVPKREDHSTLKEINATRDKLVRPNDTNRNDNGRDAANEFYNGGG